MRCLKKQNSDDPLGKNYNYVLLWQVADSGYCSCYSELTTGWKTEELQFDSL